MSQKRKCGKGASTGPKPKKIRITLPLHNNDDSEAETPSCSHTPTNNKRGKPIKAPKTTLKSIPLMDSSEGDDDDDFVDMVDDDEVDQEDEPHSNPSTDTPRRKKHHPVFNSKGRLVDPNISASDSDSSDEDIQDLAAKHIGKLTGALPDCDTLSYGEPITTPIHTQIPPKIQRKIWENKYIDFAVLLPNTPFPHSNLNQRFSLELGQNSKISLVPNTYTKKINSIEQWTSAFLRFAAIYGLKYPKEMPKLMKYAEIVRDLANRKPGLSWLMYDTQFRCLRQSQHISWDQLHTEFWVMAAATPTFRSQPRQQQPFQGRQSFNQQRSQFLRNTCWTYNKVGRCNNTECHYEHKCGLCRGRHCAKSCQTANQRSGLAQSGPEPLLSASQSQNPKPIRPVARNQTQ